VKGDARRRSETPSIGQGLRARRAHRSARATARPTNETRRSRDEDRRARSSRSPFAPCGLRRSHASGPLVRVAPRDGFRSELGSRPPASCFERAFDPFAAEGALFRARKRPADFCKPTMHGQSRAGCQCSIATRGDVHLVHVRARRCFSRSVRRAQRASRVARSLSRARTAGPAGPSEGSRDFRRASPLLESDRAPRVVRASA
jgi:hypothetical protein